MTWMLQTDQNRQNGNAGNGGDLVKHTVYLALLDELLKHEPWRSNLRLRECHAGRESTGRFGKQHVWLGL